MPPERLNLNTKFRNVTFLPKGSGIPFILKRLNEKHRLAYRGSREVNFVEVTPNEVAKVKDKVRKRIQYHKHAGYRYLTMPMVWKAVTGSFKPEWHNRIAIARAVDELCQDGILLVGNCDMQGRRLDSRKDYVGDTEKVWVKTWDPRVIFFHVGRKTGRAAVKRSNDLLRERKGPLAVTSLRLKKARSKAAAAKRMDTLTKKAESASSVNHLQANEQV